MRYWFFLFIQLICSGISAQHQGAKPTSEKYFILDTNSYLINSTPIKIKDTLFRLQQNAERSGDLEYYLSINLFRIIKESRGKLISSDTAEYRLIKLISVAKQKKLKRLEADAIHMLGDLYSKNKLQQSAAIEQYLSAYAIYKNFNTEEYPKKKENIYELGLMFYFYQDYENAIKYLQIADSINSIRYFEMYYPIMNTLGLSYRSMKIYDKAILYFQRIYDTATKRKDLVWIGISQGNIGICYYYQKKYKEAEPLLIKDIETSIEGLSIRNGVNSMIILSSIYYNQKKYDQAEKLLLKGLKLCYPKPFWPDYGMAQKLYGQLYKVYEKKQKFQLSLIYADSTLMAKDSFISQNNALIQSKFIEKQNFIKKKLEAEQMQSQAKFNQLESDKNRLRQQQQLYKFIIAFLMVILIVALSVSRYRTFLKNISTNISDAPEIIVQKMSIVLISITTCIAALVWITLYYYFYGFGILTFGPILYLFLVGPSLMIYFRTRKQQLLVNVQLISIFFIPVLMQMFGGGFQSGVVINWALLAPLGALIYKGNKQAAIWMLLLILAVIFTIIFNNYFSGFYKAISETAQSMFYAMNILGPSIIIYFIIQFFVKSVIRDGILLQKNNLILSNTLGELKNEKQKSDDLLLNILPEEVADELKSKGSTTARHFDNVTVLFTDFVNFTSAGERMSPQELVDELHTCFKAFDEITSKFNIEKIKTVGDAYLAVAGLPTADPDHAENMVKAAIEINEFMKERILKLNEKSFEIRIGIHTGKVVAGIVGVKKFAYDIWGDTVNTAARLEQNSQAGKINISQTTYELVKDKFNCKYRGEIEAKGKGNLKMYFVS